MSINCKVDDERLKWSSFLAFFGFIFNIRFIIHSVIVTQKVRVISFKFREKAISF